MFAPLKKRNFSLLWLAGLVSMIGNWMLLAALPFHVYSVTGSAFATSAILMVFVAPGILFGSVAGVFVDRWDRKHIMIVISLLQALAVLLLVMAQSAAWIWIAYVALFIEASLARFFGPAENALLPSLVGEEHLIAANSLNALNDNIGRLIGPAIGGTLLAVFGFSSVVIFDAATFVVAAALIVFVSAPAAARKPAAGQPASTASPLMGVWTDLKAGLSYVRRSPLLSRAFLIIAIALFGDAILSAILVVFVQADMGLNAAEFGWIMTARGIGGILGGLLIAQLASRFTPRGMIAGGLAGGGVGILIMLAFPQLGVIIVTMVVVSIPLMAWMVSLQTIFQKATEDSFRGRVFGALGAATMLVMFIGSGLAGVLAEGLGGYPLMIAAALIYVLAGLVGWYVMKPVDELQPAPVEVTA